MKRMIQQQKFAGCINANHLNKLIGFLKSTKIRMSKVD